MLSLPPEKRHLFQAPFGTLFSGIPEAEDLLRGRKVFAVGDVVTRNLLGHGIQPSVSIVDGYTMRLPCDEPAGPFSWTCTAKNPAGTITGDLVRCIVLALERPGSLIRVEGEEDLAVIPLVLRAPEGSALVYGQPNQGVVVRIIDAAARSDAERLLSQFVPAGPG